MTHIFNHTARIGHTAAARVVYHTYISPTTYTNLLSDHISHILKTSIFKEKHSLKTIQDITNEQENMETKYSTIEVTYLRHIRHKS